MASCALQILDVAKANFQFFPVALEITHVRADFPTLVAVVTTKGSIVDLAVSNLIRPVLALVARNIAVRQDGVCPVRKWRNHAHW